MAEDSKELTKKDIHTLNEQKRRDMIKVQTDRQTDRQTGRQTDRQTALC